MSSTSWDDLSYQIQPWIRDACISEGFKEMTPVQASTIPLLSQHKDVVVQAVTGSGKTLAFVIPVLEKVCAKGTRNGFVGIVTSPTRELASQIAQVFEDILKYQPEENRIKVQRLVGSVQSIQEDLQAYKEKRPQILVGTPGRLQDFLNHQQIKTSSCEIAILDEADKLLDPSFLPTTQGIVRMLPKQRRTGLFSATISAAGSDIFKTGMTNPVKVTVKSNNLPQNSAVPTKLQLFYMPLPPSQKLATLYELISKYRYKKVIVYFPTGYAVTQFYGLFKKLLAKDHVDIYSLHGKLDAKPRMKTLDRFSKSNAEKTVLFTTDVAARGLDIPEVDLVIQVDAPTDPEVFLHRSGRTGRANHVGKAITFLNEGREEDYVGFMAVKQVELVKQDAPETDVDAFKAKVREWLLEDRARYDHSVRAFVAFIRYYSKHVASSIFRLRELDYKGVAEMYGLTRLPKMPENRYVKDFPENGWLDEKAIDFDHFKYLDQAKEEERLHELKTEQNKKDRREKALRRKNLQEKNSSWSKKVDNKETKQERRDKAKRRRDAIEKEMLAQQDSSDSEDEKSMAADWKEEVMESKRRKKASKDVIGSFDDL